MKIRRIASLALVCTVLAQVPVLAEEVPVTEEVQSEVESWEEAQLRQLDKMEPVSLDDEQLEVFTENGGIELYNTTPDDYEPNDTWENPYPYAQVKTLTTQLTGLYDLYDLGMKQASLHSATDEDWYSVNMTAGEIYFVDLRNVGKRNWFIEVYYPNGENTYRYTTDPSIYSEYLDVGEKSFYFEAEDSGTFLIRVSSNGEWTGNEMNYFFYVGPAVQEYSIVNFPTYGQVNNLMGNSTYTFNMCDQVPSTTQIINMSLTDEFVQGTACNELSKFMRAGGITYSNSVGSNVIRGISGVSLGQIWTFGASCSKNMHSTTRWSAVMNGRFRCIMEPYSKN